MATLLQEDRTNTKTRSDHCNKNHQHDSKRPHKNTRIGDAKELLISDFKIQYDLACSPEHALAQKSTTKMTPVATGSSVNNLRAMDHGQERSYRFQDDGKI